VKGFVVGLVGCVPELGVVVPEVVEPPPPQPAKVIAKQAKDNAVSFLWICFIHGPFFPILSVPLFGDSLRALDNVYVTYNQKESGKIACMDEVGTSLPRAVAAFIRAAVISVR